MHFFFSQLARNQPLFDHRQPEYIATEKGCPFCDRYLLPVDPRREGERDASLLNQKMFCADCGVSFLIEVIARTVDGKQRLKMRFTPDTEKLSTAEAEHSQRQHDTTKTVANDEKPQKLPRSQPPNHNENQPSDGRDIVHKVPPVRNASDVPAEIPEHPNRHTDIAGQIVEYLTEHKTGKTAEMIAAFNCTTQGFNKARKKLIAQGQIRKVKRGVYQLIHHT